MILPIKYHQKRSTIDVRLTEKCSTILFETVLFLLFTQVKGKFNVYDITSSVFSEL